MKKRTNVLLYVLLTVASVAFIFVGNRIVAKDALMFTGQTGETTERLIARVDAVLSTEEEDLVLGGTYSMTQTTITFSATIMSGEKKGEGILATQNYDTLTKRMATPVREGDWLFVYRYETSPDYSAGEFIRINVIAIAAAAFFVLLLIFGRLKGLATLVALGFSVASVFLVFVPSILSGQNIYISAIVICVFTVLITPFYIGGFNAKSVASTLGSLGGVAVAGVLSCVLNMAMRITGAVDEETMQVAFILDPPIDLRAVVFASVIIGALGACIDVSTSIASPVHEMMEMSGESGFGKLFAYGMNIGRDIMGAQTSTLVLAYIGSSLSVTLLLVAYQNSLMEMLNLEMVIVELLQMLIGGFTILFTIPATALISALMFSGGGHRRRKRSGRTTI